MPILERNVNNVWFKFKKKYLNKQEWWQLAISCDYQWFCSSEKGWEHNDCKLPGLRLYIPAETAFPEGNAISCHAGIVFHQQFRRDESDT